MFSSTFCLSGLVSHCSDTQEVGTEWWWSSQLVEELLPMWRDGNCWQKQRDKQRGKISALGTPMAVTEATLAQPSGQKSPSSWLRWCWRKVLWDLTTPASISSFGLSPNAQPLLAKLQVRSHFPEPDPFMETRAVVWPACGTINHFWVMTLVN